MADIDDRGMDKTQVIPEMAEPNEETTDLGTAGARCRLRLFGREVPTLAVGVVAGALVLGLGAGVVCLVSQGSTAVDGASAGATAVAQSEAKQASAVSDDSVRQTLTLNVAADNYVAGESSPVIVHITNASGAVDFYHAFEANVDEAIELDAGAYEVSYISPVNPDGSIYRTAEAAASVNVGEGDAMASATLEYVPAGEVGTDELTQLAKDVAEAVKKGDETLTGENGTNVVSKVEENVKKNPTADVAEVEAQTSEASETAKSGASAATGVVSADKKAADNSLSAVSVTPSAESSETGQGGASSDNGGSSSDACHHVKVAVEEPTYEQRWVQDSEGYYTTEVVTDAYDEPVYGEQNYFVCSNCKATFWSESEIEDHIISVHDFEASYAARTKTVQTGTTHHAAVTKQVWHDATGHYETVQTGTRVVGYRCSVCGASL